MNKRRRTREEQRLRLLARIITAFIVVMAAVAAMALCTAPAGGTDAGDRAQTDGVAAPVPVIRLEDPAEMVAETSSVCEDPQEDFENEKIVQALYEQDYFWEDIPLDEETQAFLRAACEESGVSYAAAVALCWGETRFQNLLGDNGNSIGYLQVQPYWHQERMERLGVTDLWDPFGNFRVGLDYFAELLAKYPIEDAVTAYKSGSPNGDHTEAEKTVAYMKELQAAHG